MKKCLPIINDFTSPCEESIQCRAGKPGPASACVESKCSCDIGQDNGACLIPADKVGDNCKIDEQCILNLSDLSFCEPVKAKCGCRDEAVASSSGDRCHILITGRCTKIEDCAGIPGVTSFCHLDDTCQCGSHYVSSLARDSCLEIQSELGNECEESQKCQAGLPGPHSECSPRGDKLICQCKPTAVSQPGEHKCYLKANRIGDPCEIQEQCNANLYSSFCIGGTCGCVDPQVPSDDGKGCVDKIQFV